MVHLNNTGQAFPSPHSEIEYSCFVAVMAVLDTTNLAAKAVNLGLISLAVSFIAILWRIFYMQKLHPLSKFPGPWYASSFSIVSAIVSVLRKEPQWLMYLEKKYGSKSSPKAHPPYQQSPDTPQRTILYAYPRLCCSSPSHRR